MSMRFLPIVVPFVTSSTTTIPDEGQALPGMGTSWQEQTFELGALVVETAGVTIRDIRHIARRDVASLAATKHDRVGGTTYMELLGPDEFIHRVYVRYTPLDGVVGLRVQTSRRTSQWVGGARGLVKAVDAPKGFFINAIVGIRNTQRCWPLGVLCCPLSMAMKPESFPATRLRSLPYGASLHDGVQRDFQEMTQDVRAIVVQCDFHVMRVWVLSAFESESFGTFKNRAPLGRDEFCLELAQDEVVERVDIQSHKVVNAVRIHTSHRETPWWGRAAFGSIASIDCRRDGNKSFAGFYGTRGDHFVGSLGVVFGEAAVDEMEHHFIVGRSISQSIKTNFGREALRIGQASVNSHHLHADGHTHYVLLLPNEYVEQVDVFATDAKPATAKQRVFFPHVPSRINALRFRTYERVSEWFSHCVGNATHFKSPEGHAIHALYGSISSTKQCSQIVIYSPLVAPSAVGINTTTGTADTLTEFVRGRDTPELCFCVQCEQPRAFVVNAHGHIRSIAVVSNVRYEAFVELQWLSDAASDHWFVLAQDGRVAAVGVVFQDGRLVALWFRMNYRTSIWFGPESATDATWLNCGDSAGAFICGFQIEGVGKTTCTEVTGIAAIYKIEGEKGKGEKMATDLASKAA